MISVGSVLFIFLLTILYYWLVNRENPKPIFNVYTQKGTFYWLKYFTIFSILHIRKLKHNKQEVDEKNYHAQQKIERIERIEKPQPMFEHPKSFDDLTYIGGNPDGHKILLQIERRKRGISFATLYFWIPNRGLFNLPNGPDTMQFSTDYGEESEGFKCAGIDTYPVCPMSKWKISFKGDLKNGKESYPANIEAEFISTFQHFDLINDLSPRILAEGLAKEYWGDAFFHRVRLHNQNRYQQMGCIRGTVDIGEIQYNINLQALKDHSYGSLRDWSLIHRYAYFVLFLKNGISIVIGVISQPSTQSTQKYGYVCTRKGKYKSIKNCNFELYEHGEDGDPPEDHAFQFETEKDLYTVHILADNSTTRYIGSNWEARLILNNISCVVNGVPGYGVSEFHYNNKTGRPSELIENDPDWYKKIRKVEEYYRKANEDFLEKTSKAMSS